MLLWFFLTGLVIVIGAEMNAEIEHASPWGKAPGEKVPGQKKRIGLAAWNHHSKTGGTAHAARSRKVRVLAIPFLGHINI